MKGRGNSLFVRENVVELLGGGTAGLLGGGGAAPARFFPGSNSDPRPQKDHVTLVPFSTKATMISSPEPLPTDLQFRKSLDANNIANIEEAYSKILDLEKDAVSQGDGPWISHPGGAVEGWRLYKLPRK